MLILTSHRGILFASDFLTGPIQQAKPVIAVEEEPKPAIGHRLLRWMASLLVRSRGTEAKDYYVDAA